MTQPDEAIAAGTDSLREGQWEAAREHFAAVLAADENSVDAHEGLGWVGFYLDDPELAIGSRERAYHLHRRRGDRAGAARVATWIAVDHLEFRGELAVANGWFGRARRLLAGLSPVPEHAWLNLHQGALAVELEGDTVLAQQLGSEAGAIARSHDEVDAEMVALAVEGLALVCQGELQRGMTQLDEAAAAALAGELRMPVAVGWVCCYVIYACETARDHDRAAQWCDETARLADRLGMRYLFRVCRTHLAGVMIGRGEWEEAELELRTATQELAATRPAQAVEGVVRLGELRRRQGRSAEARELFAECEDHLWAVLGAASLALDEGQPEVAVECLRSYRAQLPEGNKLDRVLVLDLLARAHVALGQVEPARAVAKEMRDIAAGVSTPHLLAAENHASGVVALAEGDPATACEALKAASRRFREARSPYEAAGAQTDLAKALAAAGRADEAEEVAAAAARDLKRLRAPADQARQAGAAKASGGPLSARELEVLRGIARGNSDAEIAAALFLSPHTVHRHVANIRNKFGVSSRSAAVAEASRRRLI